MSNESKPPAAPATRIETIRASLRCFVCSLVGLIPLVGLPFALSAIIATWRTGKSSQNTWNPAAHYLLAARRMAPLGLLTSALFLILVCVVVPALLRDMSSCSGGSS